MELNLIYNDIKRGFDTPIDIDIGYIKDLCIKIFTLKPKTFDLIYNNDNLNKFDDNTELQEIIESEDNKISIYVKLINGLKQNNSKSLSKVNLKNPNLNMIKIKFDSFNSNYLKLYSNIKEFKIKFHEKFDVIKKLINDFEIDINDINIKIESYFNISEYNKCIEKFNENPEKISENELNILHNNIENCIKDFKIIETQNNYQIKIIDYLNNFIKKFQQIKKCCDNIKQINNFEKTITQLELLYEILFNYKLSIFKSISSFNFNDKKNFIIHLKDEFTSTKELPYIDNKKIKQNNFIQNDNNLFQKYQNNVNLFKKRISQTIDLNDDKQENNNSFSPKKNKSNILFNEKDNNQPFPQLENKSRNKIRKLTTRLKIQLSKTENDSLPNLQKKKKIQNKNKENNKKIDDKKDEKEDKKNIDLDLNKDRTQNLTLKNNINTINNTGNERLRKNSQISLIESLKNQNFKKKKSIFSEDKLLLIEQINKKMSLKNYNKTKYSISLDKKSNEKKSENDSEMRNKENLLLKSDIELLKNEIEKLKNYNNILKNDIEILKNKNESNEKDKEKENTIYGKKIFIPVKKISNLKSDSTSNFISKKITFQVNSSRNNSERKERINSDNKILSESKDSKNNKKKEKEKTQITDLSSKLLDLNEFYDNNKEEEEKTPVEKEKINYNRAQNYILDGKNNKSNNLLNDNSNGNINKNNMKRFSINYTLNEKKIDNNNNNNNNDLNNEILDNDLNSQKDDKKKKRKLNKYDFII